MIVGIYEENLNAKQKQFYKNI